MRHRPARAPRRATWLCILAGSLSLLTSTARAGDAAGIPWREDFERAYAEARAANKPLWIQFTGPWCLYCRLMDRNTFTRPEIIGAAGRDFIAVKVRSDAREDLVATYRVGGLPATVILSPDGRLELGRREGYVDPANFAAFLTSARPADPEPALGGFSPVSLVRGDGLKPGKADVAARYDGHLFRFADADERDAFLKDPEPFVPANGGLCPVTTVQDGRPADGDPHFGVYYRGRLYLCADQEARDRFAREPARFADVDLADRGYCPHCRTEDGRLVRGLPQFATTHSGRRYLFPDKVHLEAFRSSPDTYVR